jgi:PAS domain S-box-containing protein
MEERIDLDNVYRVILPGGEVRWIEALGRGVYDNYDRPIRMGGICIDITVRRQMEEILRMSEEKFSKAFMASPEAISIATMDEGIYVEVNDAFLARTGFSRDEVIGRTSTDIKVWVDAEDRNRYISELMAGGRLSNFEVRFRMKTGEIRDFLVSSEIISIYGKQCSLNYIIDVTDRKRIEMILRQEHENFIKIFSAAPVGLLLLDADTVVTHANSAMGILVLREPAEIIGARGGGAIGCVHSREDPRGCGFSASCPECPLRRRIEEVLAGGAPLRNAEINLSLIINGVPRERWLSVNADTVTLEGRGGIIVAIADVTDMKQKEIEVRESRANLRALIDNTDDIIVSRGPDGRALAYNTNFERVVHRLFGVTAFPGINTLEYLPVEMRMHWKEIIERVMTGEHYREEYSWDYGNGDVHYYDSSMNPIIVDNRIVGVTELTRDITEQKRVEETRNRLILKLESLWGLSKQQDQDFKLLTDFILEEMMKLTESRYAFYGLINDDESEMNVYSWSGGGHGSVRDR